MNDIDLFCKYMCFWLYFAFYYDLADNNIPNIPRAVFRPIHLGVCAKIIIEGNRRKKKHTCNRFYIMFFFRVQMHSASSCCSKVPWRGVEGFERVANVGSVFPRVPSEGSYPQK